jgi:hypothetical protein
MLNKAAGHYLKKVVGLHWMLFQTAIVQSVSFITESIIVNLPKEGAFKLIDMNGRQVMAGALQTGRNQIQTEGIGKGVYTIQIEVDERKERSILIKL